MAEDFNVKFTEKYYTPDPSYKKNSSLGDYQKAYDEFRKDPEAFWDRIASELHWFTPYSRVKEWNYPYARWFIDGKTNIPTTALTGMCRTPGATRSPSSGKGRMIPSVSIRTGSSIVKLCGWQTA
jgi:hypothetical protein